MVADFYHKYWSHISCVLMQKLKKNLLTLENIFSSFSLFLSSSHRNSRGRLAGNSKKCENIHQLLGFQQYSYVPNGLNFHSCFYNSIGSTEIFLYFFIEYVIMISLILKLGIFQKRRFLRISVLNWFEWILILISLYRSWSLSKTNLVLISFVQHIRRPIFIALLFLSLRKTRSDSFLAICCWHLTVLWHLLLCFCSFVLLWSAEEVEINQQTME